MKKEIPIEEAVNCLRSGGTALLPTDSVWSICCDPKNGKALEKIVQFKAASPNIEFVLLVSNERLLYQCVKEVPDIAWDMIDISETPLSLIMESNSYLPKEIHYAEKKVVVRYIKDGTMQNILHKFNRPLLSVAAYSSNGFLAPTFKEIDPTLKDSMDVVFPQRLASKMSRKAAKLLEIAIDGRVNIVRK